MNPITFCIIRIEYLAENDFKHKNIIVNSVRLPISNIVRENIRYNIMSKVYYYIKGKRFSYNDLKQYKDNL
jgi:hypothetical protein